MIRLRRSGGLAILTLLLRARIPIRVRGIATRERLRGTRGLTVALLAVALLAIIGLAIALLAIIGLAIAPR